MEEEVEARGSKSPGPELDDGASHAAAPHVELPEVAFWAEALPATPQVELPATEVLPATPQVELPVEPFWAEALDKP